MTERRKTRSSTRPNQLPEKTSSVAEEDARLWEQVMATAEPLQTKPTDRQIKSETRVQDSKSSATDKSAAREKMPRAANHSTTQSAALERADAKTKPPLSGFDRRQLRQIASGREEIEGRLDLHGFRQREAHYALKGFLMRSQAEGKRMVLIITGKGGPAAIEEVDNIGDDERGVLKRLVPKWLAEDDLRPLIVGYSPANARHGGAGALYVRLRRARG